MVLAKRSQKINFLNFIYNLSPIIFFNHQTKCNIWFQTGTWFCMLNCLVFSTSVYMHLFLHAYKDNDEREEMDENYGI